MAKIEMSVDQITDIVKKLNDSSTEIERIWNSVKNSDVQRLQQSWVGKDCDAYITKVLDMDTEIQKALKVQRLLASTFNSAKEEIVNVQEDITSKANSL